MHPSTNNNIENQIRSYYNLNSTNWNTINQQLTSTNYQPEFVYPRSNLIHNILFNNQQPDFINLPTQPPLIQLSKVIPLVPQPPPIIYPIPSLLPSIKSSILPASITKGIKFT